MINSSVIRKRIHNTQPKKLTSIEKTKSVFIINTLLLNSRLSDFNIQLFN